MSCIIKLILIGTSSLSNTDVSFPSVKIRTGRKTFKENAIRCLVQRLSDTTSSPYEICKVAIGMANMISGDYWRVASDDCDDDANDGDRIED